MRRSAARALLAPCVTTLVMLAILLTLGVWQLHRRNWKLAIIAEIDRAESSPPIPLPAHPLPFTRVSVTGTLRSDLSAFYGVDVRDVPGGTAIGAQLVQPLERPGQLPVLIDRGWVREGQQNIPGGEVTVVGYIREPAVPGAFSPADDLVTRHFYTLDPAKIGDSLGLAQVAPFTLVAMGNGGMPEPVSALPRPPNDHLNYAITWFSLAATLLTVFAVYARRVLRA